MGQPLLLNGIEWLLFDAVGTLIYPDPPVAEVYHAAGQRFGSRLSMDEIRRRFHAALTNNQTCGEPTNEAKERDRWRRIVRSVLDDVDEGCEELFESLWQHFAQPQYWRTFDDVAVLAELRTRGYRIGIASNFDDRLIRIAAVHPPLAICEAIFVSSNVGFTKPDQRFFRAIENQLGVEPRKIALVGDDEISDVQGATEAGWRAVRLDRSGLISSPATIHSLAELL
ncbi:MAG TPA: HAD-IA family hydrolase [Pirellulaceae bacterium]